MIVPRSILRLRRNVLRVGSGPRVHRSLVHPDVRIVADERTVAHNSKLPVNFCGIVPILSWTVHPEVKPMTTNEADGHGGVRSVLDHVPKPVALTERGFEDAHRKVRVGCFRI